MPLKITYAKLKKELDKVFSLYVRLKNSENGYNQCITCGKFFSVKKIHCGHYIPRNNLSVRWDERNCSSQCCGCNVFGNGRPDVFALKLKEKYGEGILEELNRKKNLPSEINKYNILEYIEKYKKLLKGLNEHQKA